MDKFAVLFDAQLILIVAVLVAWAKKEALIRWERKARRTIRRIRRHRQPVEARPTPRMTAEEIVRVVNSL